jgi:dephospho-CoA kinase
MKNIILFGPMGAGKGTVADILIQEYGYVKGSLGAKIHAETALHGTESREEMQEYGQAMRRIFGENVWNDYLFNQLHNTVGQYLKAGRVVIDDGRQLNEFDYWKAKGFLTVGITAEQHLRAARLEKRNGKPTPLERFHHDTEVQALKCFDKCDYLIFNNFDLATLRKAVEGVFQCD